MHLLAVTLNGMLDRLEAARTRQREFVADAAHELRSPLTNMRTQLEVAQHLGSSADPELVNDLLTDTKRLARLVDDLLLLARTDDSAEIARPVPVDLTALLLDAAARYPVVAVSLPEDPLWTSGDPDALLRIITNLLDNAVRHAASSVSLSASSVSSPTSSVSSTSSSGGGLILVTVTDDGPGIPAGDRERVFERFTRLDDARARDDGGSGLGLAIVRELVRRHGGRVRLLDAPSGGPGLLVEVDLPAAVL